MEFVQVQTFLENFSFSVLFLLMLFYWIEASFFSKLQYHFFGFIGTALVNFSLALLLIIRWFEEGHFPLSNLYESLIFLSWSFTFIHIILEKITPHLFIGVITSPIALLTNAFGAFTLPAEMQKANSLVPALQSNWLMMHVTIMILSYASLIIGSLFAILYLVITFYQENRRNKLPLFPVRSKTWEATKGANGVDESSEVTIKNKNFKEDNINVTQSIFSYGRTTLFSKSTVVGNQEINFLKEKRGNQNLPLKPTGFKLTVPFPETNHRFVKGTPIQISWERAPLQVDCEQGLRSNPNFKEQSNSYLEKTSFSFFSLWKKIPHFKNFQEGYEGYLLNKNKLGIPAGIRKEETGHTTDYFLLSQNLDNLSYRILGIGFPLLTIGILSGAVWANEAWGSYWSWDPKETWALITWLTYAIYLHTRITNGWSGKKPAIIASIGFIVVWICYLGVNLLGKGLHSYGWVQSLNNLF